MRVRAAAPFKLALRQQQRRFILEAAAGTPHAVPGDDDGEGLLRKYDRGKLHGDGDQVIDAYKEKLQEAGLVDLIGVRGLAKTELARARNEDAPLVLPKDGVRIWHLIVDELQDTSLDQLKLILAFAAHAGVSAAGDDDQPSTLSAARSARWSSASWP